MNRYNESFSAGDPVLFIDAKEREYYDILEAGRQTDIRGDLLPHDQIIGESEGFIMQSSRKKRYLVFKPTLEEHVRKMPRGAQVIYPKDISLLLMYGDIYPGAKVVECGLGSGALTSALLRAVGPKGRVVSYEMREDFVRNASKNIRTFLGEPPNHTIRLVDIYERFEDREVDRLLLDVPEPWRAIRTAAAHLRPGAIVASYSPTVPQVAQFVDALRQWRVFTRIQTIEAFIREWKVDRVSVRPELRMVAHTAFLTFARRTSGELPGRDEPAPEIGGEQDAAAGQ